METKILENHATLTSDTHVARTLYSEKFDLGLCSTCSLVTTCTFPSMQKGQKVVHCEEFDANLEENFSEKVIFPYEEDTIPTTSSKSFLGLCSNCEKRTFCSLAKPLAGIWHCEEYE